MLLRHRRSAGVGRDDQRNRSAMRRWILRGNPVTAVAAAGVALFVAGRDLRAAGSCPTIPWPPTCRRRCSRRARRIWPAPTSSGATCSAASSSPRGSTWLSPSPRSASPSSSAPSSARSAAMPAAGSTARSAASSTCMMAFPLFVLAMAMVAALGNRIENIVDRDRDHQPALLHPLRPRRGQRPPQCRLGGGGAGLRREPSRGRAALPAAEHPAGDGGADLAQSRLGDPERRRPVLHRPRRQAADAGMGHHGRGGRALHHHRRVVAGRLSRAWR